MKREAVEKEREKDAKAAGVYGRKQNNKEKRRNRRRGKARYGRGNDRKVKPEGKTGLSRNIC